MPDKPPLPVYTTAAYGCMPVVTLMDVGAFMLAGRST